MDEITQGNEGTQGNVLAFGFDPFGARSRRDSPALPPTVVVRPGEVPPLLVSSPIHVRRSRAAWHLALDYRRAPRLGWAPEKNWVSTPASDALTAGDVPVGFGRMPGPISHPRDPLHGITLESIINTLVQRHGWGEMGRRIPVRCFQYNPTVKSSLTFLRKTPWARERVEGWFLSEL